MTGKSKSVVTGRSEAELAAAETGDKGVEEGSRSEATASTTPAKAAAQRHTASTPTPTPSVGGPTAAGGTPEEHDKRSHHARTQPHG